MPFEKYLGEPLLSETPVCRHLRNKGMYVTGELRLPEHPEETLSHSCWCNISQHVLGPDQGAVDPRTCSPERACYQQV